MNPNPTPPPASYASRSLGARNAAKSRQPFLTIGNRIASAWRVPPNSVWIQVRSHHLARILRKRKDTSLVAHGFPFLLTFQIHKSLPWAQKWINRHHIPNLMSAGTEHNP